MDKKDIVIVIPIYRTDLLEQERKSLLQCVTLLSDYSIVILKPESLNIDSILIEFNLKKVELFPDECFSSLRAYNKTVLSSDFYLRFSQYKYMLIYQLDAYVFRDELLYWANRGYDYIGAPWIPINSKLLYSRWERFCLLQKSCFYRLIGSNKFKKPKYHLFRVGNGGFSLRKISKFIEITQYYEDKIRLLLSDNCEFYPEDLFLNNEIANGKCKFKRPAYRVALKFSMEMNPEWCYNRNGKQLPFGCHAWYHKDFAPFWSQIIKS